MEKDGPKVKYFISGIILGFLVMFYGIISNSSFLIGMGSIVIGIDVVFFPFTTPETTAFFGISKGKISGPRSRYIPDSSWNMGGDYSLMNRDAEAAALTCGSLFLQQFRFLLDHCQKYQRFFSATGNGMAAAVLAERRHARLHRICFVIILIYSLPGQNVIHFRLAVMLMVRELIAR